MRVQLCAFFTVLAILAVFRRAVYGCRAETTYLTARSTVQAIVFPDMTLLSNGQSQSCSWVISSIEDSDVIGFQVTDWFGPTSHSCVRDYLTIRDGASPVSPSLRLVCGTSRFKGPVSSSTPSIYVHVNVFVNDGQRGFALEYWSVRNDPIVMAAPEYGTANYILIGVTIVVTLTFVVGVFYLIYKEKTRERKAQEGQMKQILKRRRKGISGISGMEDSCGDMDTSRTDVTSFVETPSPVLNEWRV